MQKKSKLLSPPAMFFALLLFFLGGNAGAQTHIYRSAGPGATDALVSGATGPNGLDIAGAAATFDSPVPDSVGVGDAIQYDSDNDGVVDAVAFIHARLSSAEYVVKDASGSDPAPVADDFDWSVFRAYTSLANAESGEENPGIDDAVKDFDAWTGGKDIVSSDEIWHIACYAGQLGAADHAPVVVDGWTTDQDRYIEIFTPVTESQVGTSQRHQGVWDDSKYCLDVNSGVDYTNGFTLGAPFTKVDGLQIKRTGTSNTYAAIRLDGAYQELSNSIVNGDGGYGVMLDGECAKVWNVISYNGNSNFQLHYSAGSNYLYNVTAVNGVNGFFNGTYRSFAIKNALASGNSSADFSLTGGGALSCDFCASSDDTADDLGGEGNRVGQTFSFANPAGDDFHLAIDDTGAKDFGTDCSADPNLAFSDDIDGESRPFVVWDIGADEGDPDATAPSAVGDLAVVSCGSTFCDLTWTCVGDDGNTGTAYAYDMRYSTTAIEDDQDFASAAEASQEPDPGPAGTPDATRVSGLAPSADYWFALKVSDESSNISDLSNIAPGRTEDPDVEPPTPPSDLGVEKASYFQIDLSWIGSQDNTGVAGYTVYRCKGQGCDPTTPVGTVAENRYEDWGLASGASYAYAVSAFDEAGNPSNLSEQAAANTLAILDVNQENVFPAASCALPDVQAAADAAMASAKSDVTIYVPACSTLPCSWAQGTALSLDGEPGKKFRLIGSGTQTTHILHFQIDLPVNGVLDLVEVAYITADGNGATSNMLDYRLRPETLNNELVWHDLVVQGYTGGYTLTLEGWKGVVSNIVVRCADNPSGQNPYGITVQGDGEYSDHTADFGTDNAVFIEDSVFYSCSHTVSHFCDGYSVFRKNNVIDSDSHTDLHGPGYNGCYYNGFSENTAGGGYEIYDNVFSQAQGNWTINARAGQGHIIANNSFDDENYTILLYWDSQSTNFGNNCGTDPGETCARCYTLNCDYGCCQAQEKTYIWDNDGRVIEYTPTGFDDCLVQDETYFLRPPSIDQDGFQWTPYAYPHPLASAKPASYEARILFPTENLAVGGEEIIRFSITNPEPGMPQCSIDNVNWVDLVPESTHLASLPGWDYIDSGATFTLYIRDGRAADSAGNLSKLGANTGDLNNDGKRDLADLVLALQILAGLDPSAPVRMENEIGDDDRIGAEEAAFLQQYISRTH